MDVLRTIILLEHEVIPIVAVDEGGHDAAAFTTDNTWLTETEAQALLRLNDVRRGFCQRVSGGVKLAQYCGIVRLKTCVLEVLPKVGISDARAADELERSRAALLIMLHSARDVRITKVGTAPQRAVHAPLLDVFVTEFLQSALEQARRGLLCRYVSHTDDLPVMKGRFHAQGHLRRNLGRPHLLHCEHDDFTADNPYNRAIKRTLNVCRAWITQESTQRLWFEAQSRFSAVTDTKISAAEVARLPRERTTRRYESVLTWCERLLAMMSPALSAGTMHAPALLFDMNKLFESYVASLEEEAASESQIVFRQGPAEALATHGETEAFYLKPDITLWHASTKGSASVIACVIDAKWKRLNPRAANWGVDQSDVYQLLAYGLRYGCKRLELVYPAQWRGDESEMERPIFYINTFGINEPCTQLRIRTISLWA